MVCFSGGRESMEPKSVTRAYCSPGLAHVLENRRLEVQAGSGLIIYQSGVAEHRSLAELLMVSS